MADINKTRDVEVKDAKMVKTTTTTTTTQDERDFSLEDYPVREVEFTLPGFKGAVAFNPFVSLIGVVCLWGLAAWCMADPEGSNELLTEWRSKVTLYFTWLFMGTRGIFFFFLIFIVFKYGHVKLGHKDEPPEFTTSEYFSMVFAAGVAVGLFVYGVAEPLFHQSSHYYAESGYRTQDEVDMFAINMTITNWGIGGWSTYLIVAVCMALAGHRFNLPMTFRSCFYPILGEYTWGWLGDLVDGFTIVVTVGGVCTSLGLGAIQIVDGFKYLGWVQDNLSESKMTSIQNATIWVITCIATISVVSGLNAGVKLLSMGALLLGMLLLLLVFVMDDTKFLMNLVVQELGYFLQWSTIQLNFWTDAFAQLRPGEGRAIDDSSAAVWWMDAWALFYQAWWVSWSSFVGLFIARISRGRTLGEVITYSMVVPTLYCIVWFSIWGGIGLRQARQALEMEKLGADYFGNSEELLVDGSQFCYNVPQETLMNGTTVVFENHLPGVTPVCKFDSGNSGFAAFEVLHSFSFPGSFGNNGLGPVLSVIFLVALTIYFATSSDSGSLVVDHLASNGRKNHHWIQRVFWAFTEGAVATALLSAGGSNALSALQAASIVLGLPFCFMLIYLVQSIYLMCEAASDPSCMIYTTPTKRTFSVPIYGGIFNAGEFVTSLGRVNQKRVDLGIDKPTTFHAVEFFKGLFVPFVSLYQVLSSVYPRRQGMNIFVTGCYTLFFLTFVAIFAGTGSSPGILGWGWATFFAAGTMLCSIRGSFRHRYNIRSNVLGDAIASLFFWPQVMVQMRQTCVDLNLPEDDRKGHLHSDNSSEENDVEALA